jgi:hypothetical protein
MKFKINTTEVPFLWQFQADKFPIIDYFKKCVNTEPEGGWKEGQKEIVEQIKQGLELVLDEAGKRKWFTILITSQQPEIRKDDEHDIFSI